MKPATETPSALEAVRVLAPEGGVSLSEFLAPSARAPAEPFAQARIEAVGALSAAFLKDPVLKHDPASVAVGYWMRPAQVARLQTTFEAKRAAEPSIVRVPVGRVLHITPGNVDTLFIYSWALSYLCGNANIVRISQERSAAVEAMLRVLSAVAGAVPDLAASNRFVTYPHDDQTTARLSAWCTHRIIWGGDETVAAIRAVPLGPHASERAFGSKFSYAVFSADRYLAAPDAERDRLAAGFFNDLFWFDQMACSSPHIVFWVSDENKCTTAVPDFEDRLQREVDRKRYVPSASAAVHRLVHAFELAADGDVKVGLEHPGFIGVQVRDVRFLDKQICGGGFIRHARLDRLEELEGFASQADQTITAFGFERDQLRELAARIGARGVDRIVPVGQALSFDVVWDGFDLIEDLTRKVTVRVG